MRRFHLIHDFPSIAFPKMRNPLRDSNRSSEALREKTLKRVERYYGKLALLQTWELAATGRFGIKAERIAVQADMAPLTRTVRQERSYLEHRADSIAAL